MASSNWASSTCPEMRRQQAQANNLNFLALSRPSNGARIGFGQSASSHSASVMDSAPGSGGRRRWRGYSSGGHPDTRERAVEENSAARGSVSRLLGGLREGD